MASASIERHGHIKFTFALALIIKISSLLDYDLCGPSVKCVNYIYYNQVNCSSSIITAPCM